MAGSSKSSGSFSLQDEDSGDKAQVSTKTSGEKALHTISEVSLQGGGDPTNTPGCPTLSSKYRIDWSETKQDLPKSTSSYLEVYSYTGSGKFISAFLNFNSENVYVKITIDGEELFEMDMDALHDAFPTGGEDGLSSAMPCGIRWDRQRDVFYFCPSCPIVYTSSVSIECRANTPVKSRDLTSYFIQLTKET